MPAFAGMTEVRPPTLFAIVRDRTLVVLVRGAFVQTKNIRDHSLCPIEKCKPGFGKPIHFVLVSST